MRIDLAGAALAAAFVAGASNAAAAADIPTFRIERAAARVVVIPEARGDITYTIKQGRADLRPLTSRQDGGVIVVDGGYGGPFIGIHINEDLNCRGSGDRISVNIRGKGWVPLADLPVVTVRTPLDSRISAGGAIYGEVGPSSALDLGSAGCGDWRAQDVKGELRVRIAGSADFHGASAGDADVGVSGSGDILLGGVRALTAHIAGSGDVKVGAVQGPLAAQISGSGDITVERGAAPAVRASIAGSGNIRFGGAAGALSATIAGSGDVNIAKVDGPVSRHVVGSGSVNVGR
jgi:hypothetical protein